MVRVIVELASGAPEDDDNDAQRWTVVDDWELMTAMHLTCARNALSEGEDVPYAEELEMLALHDFKDGVVAPPLMAVDGGKST
jgi:hypothetical protein